MTHYGKLFITGGPTMSKLKTLVIGLSTAFLLTSYSYANSTNDIVSMAEDIDPVALVQLGNLYRDGNGVTKSYAKAVWYYTVAVNRGNAKGQYELGNMYCKGLGVKRSYEKHLTCTLSLLLKVICLL